MLPIYPWGHTHPKENGDLQGATPLKKNDFLLCRSLQLSITSSLEGGQGLCMLSLSLRAETLPTLTLNNFVYATVFVLTPWVKESCHIHSTLFCSSLPWLAVLRLFVLPLLQWCLSIGERVIIELSHSWLSSCGHLFSILRLVVSLCFNCQHLHNETYVMRSESFTNLWGERFRGKFMLFSKQF